MKTEAYGLNIGVYSLSELNQLYHEPTVDLTPNSIYFVYGSLYSGTKEELVELVSHRVCAILNNPVRKIWEKPLCYSTLVTPVDDGIAESLEERGLNIITTEEYGNPVIAGDYFVDDSGKICWMLTDKFGARGFSPEFGQWMEKYALVKYRYARRNGLI